MKDFRYLNSKERFIDYAFDVFKKYFTDKKDLISFFDSISDDEDKNEFLRIAGFYKFLVKDGKFKYEAPQIPEYIEYIDTTYKFVALFSLIEALYSKDTFLDFYTFLTRKKVGFPIKNKEELGSIYERYKKEWGSIQKAVKFFSLLDNEHKDIIVSKLKVEGRDKSILYLAKLLYRIRSEFVHQARLITEFSGVTTLGRRGKRLMTDLSIEDMQAVFEYGLLRHFGYRRE